MWIFSWNKKLNSALPEFFSIHGFIHDFSSFLNMSIWLSGNECQGCNHILTWTFSPSNIWPTTLVLCLGSCESKLYNSPAGRLLGCRGTEVLGSMVRINGLFHLLINGVYWGYNSLTNHLLSSWYIQVGIKWGVSQQKYTDEQKNANFSYMTSKWATGWGVKRLTEDVPFHFRVILRFQMLVFGGVFVCTKGTCS